MTLRQRLLSLPRPLRWAAVGAGVATLFWTAVVIAAAVHGIVQGARGGDVLAALDTGVQNVFTVIIMLVMIGTLGGLAGLSLGLLERAVTWLVAARRSRAASVRDERSRSDRA